MSLMLTPDRLAAQTVGTAPPTDAQQIISTSPLLLMFQWFNLEYDRRVTPSLTLGVSVSRLSLGHGDVPYATGTGIIRYYPSGSAMRGFYLGGRAGAYRFSDGPDSDTFFGAGFEIGYDWLLGRRQNVGLSLGVGATRMFGTGVDDVPVVLPTLRLLNVGIAF